MKQRPVVVNGWFLYAHLAFKEYMRKLALAVGQIKERRPDSWEQNNIVSLRKAIARTCLVEVPNDPTDSRYRQRNTLWEAYGYWFRAKPANRHRLFFVTTASVRSLLTFGLTGRISSEQLRASEILMWRSPNSYLTGWRSRFQG